MRYLCIFFACLLLTLAPPSIAATFDETLKAAKLDDAEAQVNVGKMYFEGQNVTRNYVEAAKWFRNGIAKLQIKKKHAHKRYLAECMLMARM